MSSFAAWSISLACITEAIDEPNWLWWRCLNRMRSTGQCAGRPFDFVPRFLGISFIFCTDVFDTLDLYAFELSFRTLVW